MCPFVEKKEKGVVFRLTYKYKETAYTIFSTPSNPPPPPIIPTPPIINNCYNVQPLFPSPRPYYSNPSYYLGLKSNIFENFKNLKYKF